MVPIFQTSHLRALCEILGDTQFGFTGSEIGKLLGECGIVDIAPAITKRDRIYAALFERQRQDRCGNNVIKFIITSMEPVRHHSKRDWYEDTRSKLNRVLAFSGYELREDGQIISVKTVKTHSEADARASRLKESLLLRNVHPDVFLFCKSELLVDNYFHAVFEATKSVAEKIRTLSCLPKDGAELVDDAFSFKNNMPHIALNSLQTDSEKSEQKGFMNLLKGLFGTFRNVTAHAPKIKWKINEQDALDILSLVSLIHRRLDDAVCPRKLYG